MSLESLLPPSTQARLKRARFGGTREAVGSLIGNYQSAFKGAGLTFSELREYAPGDEVRSIDWKASARSSRVYVRSYEEERQLRMLVALDVSASLNSSITACSRKRSVEFCALLAYLARQSHDQFGLCLFSSGIHTILPPDSTRAHWQHITQELTAQLHPAVEKQPRTTSLPSLFTELKSHLRNKTCIFIVSDFFASSYEKELGVLASKNFTTCVHISPELDEWLPKSGLMYLQDAESTQMQMIDSSSEQTRASLSRAIEHQRDSVKEIALRCRAHYLPITHNADGPFFKFLRRRTLR